MSTEAQFTKPREKRRHPEAKELLAGADLSSKALLERAATGPLYELIANAEYWLSFELSTFEALLMRAPSPLRELGVGIALRFGEGIDGQLHPADLAAARAFFSAEAPAELGAALEMGLGSLERAVAVRERLAEFEAEGFQRYAATQALSVHGLRAGGSAEIEINGAPLKKDTIIALGAPVELRAIDEKKRHLAPPEIESELSAPLWAKPVPDKGETRVVLFVVPGRYRLRVPGRADATKTVLVT
ncbi:MAG: hypothetical protein U1E65_23925 [Myxococcota bacterium]